MGFPLFPFKTQISKKKHRDILTCVLLVGGGDFEKKSSKSGPRKLFILMMEMCDMQEKYTILLLFML